MIPFTTPLQTLPSHTSPREQRDIDRSVAELSATLSHLVRFATASLRGGLRLAKAAVRLGGGAPAHAVVSPATER